MSESGVVAMATVVLVAITAYYAWQNHKMVIEMQKARVQAIAPHLVLRLSALTPEHLFPEVVNAGLGPAVNVDLTLTWHANVGHEHDDVRVWRTPVVLANEGHQFMVPEGSSQADFLAFPELAERFSGISIAGSMQDALGNPLTFSDSIEDLAAYWKALTRSRKRFFPPALERIAESIKKIADNANA